MKTAAGDSERVDRDFWIEAFEDYLGLEAGNSPHTVENYLRDIRRLAEYSVSRKAKAPNQVTPELLRDHIYELKDLGLAATSIRRAISAVRTYFRFLIGEGHISNDPSGQLETPKTWRSLPEVLSVQEIEALLAAPNPDEPLAWRDRALLEVAYATGVRLSLIHI